MPRIKITTLKTIQIEVAEPITDSHGVAKALDFAKELDQEHFFVLTLRGDNSVKQIYTATIGILNKTQVHPREVFKFAIQDRAASVIIAHNHPSGTNTPSTQDDATTKTLVSAGKILGINVLDHIIIAKHGHFSYQGERKHLLN